MPTLQNLIETRLSNLEAAYQSEKARIQGELAGLVDSGWLQRDEAELKAWIANAEGKFSSWVATAKQHLGV